MGFPGAPATEAAPAWIASWRFRFVLAMLILILAAGAILIVQYFSGTFQGTQDPSIDNPVVPSAAPAHT